MTARDEILSRVRAALAGTQDEPAPKVPRGYRSRAKATHDVLTRFVERVEDYGATVERCTDVDVPVRVAAALPSGCRVLLPPELPWPTEATLDTTIDAGLAAADLDRYDAVVTAATLGIAETGTIVLTHGPAEGRRALSLVPDLHVCIVRSDQVVAGVPAAVAQLDPLRPQTWVSGGSATSDIELDRVEGVHGPRRLHVLLVEAR